MSQLDSAESSSCWTAGSRLSSENSQVPVVVLEDRDVRDDRSLAFDGALLVDINDSRNGKDRCKEACAEEEE